jgi:hypothetical protein
VTNQQPERHALAIPAEDLGEEMASSKDRKLDLLSDKNSVLVSVMRAGNYTKIHSSKDEE